MAKSLLSKLGKAAATGLTALALTAGIGASKASGATMNWGSFSDIAPLQSGAVSYTSGDSTVLPNQVSGIYYIITPEFTHVAAGGFDLKNGSVSVSYFNPDTASEWGLVEGDTANTGSGSNSQNAYPGYWEIFYDSNNDGVLGTHEGSELYDRSELLDSSQYSISNFSPYGSENPGNFTFTTEPVPEPATVSLIGIGTAAAVLRRRMGKGNSAK